MDHVIQDAVWTHRRRYNTIFILKAAIYNPHVIIVFRDSKMAKDEQSHYYHLISKLNFWQKLMLKRINWRFFKNPMNYTFFKTTIAPLFVSVGQLSWTIKGSDRALVFDNSCFS